jgi:DNA-binding response OmpR family regulator
MRNDRASIEKVSDSVLVVEDEFEERMLLEAILEDGGYRVLSASSGRTAWDMIRAHKPGVVLLDWMIPGLDGIALTQAMRADAQYSDSYIVMVSGRQSTNDKVFGMRAGVNDYVTKPFQTEELLARVDLGLRVVKLQRQLKEQIRIDSALEMAVAVAHHLASPVTAARLLQHRLEVDLEMQSSHSVKDRIASLGDQLSRIEEVIRKLQSIKQIRSIPYVDEVTMISLERPTN